MELSEKRSEFKKILSLHSDLHRHKQYEKGHKLLVAGNKTDSIWYIESGIIKTCIEDVKQQKFHTIAFYSKDELLVPYSCIVKDEVANFSIDVVRDTKVRLISKTNWYKLMKREPIMVEIMHEIAVDTMYKFLNYICDSKKYNTTEWYIKLMREMPFLKSLTDTEIAEYLGVDRATINIVKNKLKK